MEIVIKKTDDLIPYENNPRYNDNAVDYVAKSIEEFGFKNPIIVDKNDVIVAGHTRLKAAEQLGIEEVPTIMVSDLTEEQVNAFRLIDNKTAEYAAWDLEKLDDEIEKIKDISMEDFGFVIPDDIDYDNFFGDAEEKEKEKKTITCPKCGEVIEL